MKRTGLIFVIVCIYIFAAFAWWTFSHIRNSRTIRGQQLDRLELLCYKATLVVNGEVNDGTLPDTNAVKTRIASDFPELEIIFADEAAMDNFLIRPQHDTYRKISSEYDRRFWMYTLEGFVMVSLLLWGVMLIYRSFLSRIRLRKQQSNFLLSVTHELKTPLASIKLYLETLQRRKASAEQESTIISNSLQDVDRLAGLVDNMLLAAQLENNRYEPEMSELDLSTLLEDTVNSYATPRNLCARLVKNITPGIFIQGDAFAITMVINNLISNAFKYSPPEARIDVQLQPEAGGIVMRFCNEGQCIADEDKKYIFEKFYRTGDESTRNSKGTGLGLFIVRNLLTLHQATIQVTDRKPSGVVFTITFRKDAA